MEAKNTSSRSFGDLESGGGSSFYPDQPVYEIPLRWTFIRKIYTILTLQLLLTSAVAAAMVFYHPLAHFFASTPAGLAVYIFLIIFALILLCPLFYYSQSHPINIFLLALFTLCISFSVGLTCAFTSGKVILESAILTAVVVLSLTAYTFWAASRGYDFSFMGPFLFSGLTLLLVFICIQVIFPLGKLSLMIYGALASIIFSGYIIYDTANLIERYSYDEYVLAAISLYLDIINLFLSLLTLLSEAQD